MDLVITGRVATGTAARGGERPGAVAVVGAAARCGRGGCGVDAATEVDPAVVRAAARGDRGAFGDVVACYDDRLRALAYHMLRDAESTRDALQDAYVKAYLGLPSFRGESGLGTWLYRIVYTTCLNHLRSAARRPRLIARDDGQAPSDAAAQPDHADEVEAAVDLASLLLALPVEQRAAVLLVDAHGLGYARTAAILGVPVGTVASRVAGARARLRAALSADREGLPAGPANGRWER